jgi:hypothetical protein
MFAGIAILFFGFLKRYHIKNVIYIVTCRPIAMERVGKQTRNKHATKNRVDPFLGNAHNTRTQQ